MDLVWPKSNWIMNPLKTSTANSRVVRRQVFREVGNSVVLTSGIEPLFSAYQTEVITSILREHKIEEN